MLEIGNPMNSPESSPNWAPNIPKSNLFGSLHQVNDTGCRVAVERSRACEGEQREREPGRTGRPEPAGGQRDRNYAILRQQKRL